MGYGHSELCVTLLASSEVQLASSFMHPATNGPPPGAKVRAAHPTLLVITLAPATALHCTTGSNPPRSPPVARLHAGPLAMQATAAQELNTQVELPPWKS